MMMMAINRLGCEDLEQCKHLLSNSGSFKLAHIYNNITFDVYISLGKAEIDIL